MAVTFPDGKRFAFTIFDDTDVGTLESLRPIYDLLAQLGLRTTKTVWPLDYLGSSAFAGSVTLEDKAQGALGVAVRGCYLSRQYELHPRIKIGGDFRLPAQPGVLEHKNAAFRFLRGDE